MHLDVCLNIGNCVLLGLDWVEPMMQFFFSTSHVHAYVPFLFYIFVLSCDCVSSPSLSFSRIDYAWHPSANLLRSDTLFILGHLLLVFPLITIGSVMRMLTRTSRRMFLNVAFIQSAMWFYWTFPILIFSMSFTLENGNLFVRYPWGVPPCSYRSFIPSCMVSIPLCLNLS